MADAVIPSYLQNIMEAARSIEKRKEYGYRPYILDDPHRFASSTNTYPLSQPGLSDLLNSMMTPSRGGNFNALTNQISIDPKAVPLTGQYKSWEDSPENTLFHENFHYQRNQEDSHMQRAKHKKAKEMFGGEDAYQQILNKIGDSSGGNSWLYKLQYALPSFLGLGIKRQEEETLANLIGAMALGQSRNEFQTQAKKVHPRLNEWFQMMTEF